MNLLKNAVSTYLKSHSENPVSWHEWNNDTLEKAKKENKIIIISIGYATCHWCHVMNRESFSDEKVANLMNQHFVNIKIDREERPDLDQLYMHAVHIINKRGGWPLNCFATPDGKPFYGGTYFPKENWMDLLNHIQDLWQNEPHKILSQANQIANYVDTLPEQFFQQNPFADFSDAHKSVKEKIVSDADMKYGGLKGEPKFLMPGHLNFLLDSCFYDNDSKTKEYVEVSLEKFAQGGIHDHLAGGFARYSVDKYWKIPHFEKTLYDNAQIISLYTKAYKQFQKPEYKAIAEQTADFAIHCLKNKQDLYFSGIDADSEGVEGKFYVWTKKEIEEVLGEEASIIVDWFGIDAESLWEEDLNVLTQWQNKQTFSQRHQMAENEFDEFLKIAKLKLLEHRNSRVRPIVDSNIIVSWNAMMLEALLDLAEISEDKYKKLAFSGLDLLLEEMYKPQQKVSRIFGKAKEEDGFLEDYVGFAKLLIKAYLSSHNQRYLDLAQEVGTQIIENFNISGEPLLSYTSKNNATLFAKSVELFDNVIPSSNAMAGVMFLKLGLLLSSEKFVDKARRMATAGMYLCGASPTSSYHWANLIMMFQKDTYVIKNGTKTTGIPPYHPMVLMMPKNNQSTSNKIEVCGINSCYQPFNDISECFDYLQKIGS